MFFLTFPPQKKTHQNVLWKTAYSSRRIPAALGKKTQNTEADKAQHGRYQQVAALVKSSWSDVLTTDGWDT